MGSRKETIKTGKGNVGKTKESYQTTRSSILAKKGLKTSAEFAAVMSAMIGDILEGNITSQTANAVCNVTGKLLKIVEMKHKYAPMVKGGVLRLTA